MNLTKTNIKKVTLRGDTFDALEKLCCHVLSETAKMNRLTGRLVFNFDPLVFDAEQVLEEIRSLDRQDKDFKEFDCVLSHTTIDDPEDLRDDWPHAITKPG